jgi:hypothetical protein
MTATKEIVFSGMPQNQPVKVVQCYLCKRANRSSSALVMNGAPATKDLTIKLIGFKKQDTLYKFLLCDECLILLSGLAALPKETE